MLHKYDSFSCGGPSGALDSVLNKNREACLFGFPVISGCYVAGATRLELATSGVTGGRVTS